MARGERADWVSPEQVLGFLRRQWIVICLVTLGALAVGMAYAVLSPPKYRSFARLLIDPRGLQILKNEITKSSETTDGALVDVENQRYVILSRSILEAVVERAELADHPLFGAAPGGFLRRGGGSLMPADRVQKALAVLADSVDVVRGERAYILDVVVTTRDAKVSADIANLIAKVYLERENGAKNEAAKRASAALSDRADELRHEVQKAEEDAESFKQRNNLSTGPTGQLLSDQQLTDLSSQLSLARGRTAEAQARVEQIDAMRKGNLDPANLPENVQSPVIVGLRAQYAQLVQQESSLVSQLGPRHPALQQVREQLKDVRKLIGSEVDRMAQIARNELDRAKKAEAALSRSMSGVRSGNDTNATALVRLRELERAADAKRTIYQSVMSRAKELEEQQGIDTSNTRIISNAFPALKPSGPPLALVLAGAIVFGFGVGAGIGFVREKSGGRFTARDDVESLTGLPVIASLRESGPRALDGEASSIGFAAAEREAALNVLYRLCWPDGGASRVVAFIGLHNDAARARLMADLMRAASDEEIGLRRVACGPIDSALDRSAATIPVGELLAGAKGPPSLRLLRDRLAALSDRSDLVVLDTPPLADVGMPPALVKAVDAVVLVIADRDLNRRDIDILTDYVAKAGTPPVGVVLTGNALAA